MHAESRYVLVKGDLGLGNRILSLLSAALLARLTGRRLLVDWRDGLYAADGANAFPELLASDLAEAFDALPETRSVAPPAWRGRLDEAAITLRGEVFGPTCGYPWMWERFSVDLARIDRPERVLVFVCFFELVDPLRRFMTGPHAALRRLPTEALLRHLWDEHLRLAEPLQARVERFRRDALGGPAVGVHVRASDLWTRVAAIERAVGKVVARRPELAVFLATDNRDVLERYERLFPRVVSTPKWYPRPGKPMHDNADRPDALQGARDALVDLHLLAGCEHLVIDSRSSFGRLAALRSVALRDRIVDVHPGRHVPLPLRRHVLRLRARLSRRAL